MQKKMISISLDASRPHQLNPNHDKEKQDEEGKAGGRDLRTTQEEGERRRHTRPMKTFETTLYSKKQPLLSINIILMCFCNVRLENTEKDDDDKKKMTTTKEKKNPGGDVDGRFSEGDDTKKNTKRNF